MLERAEPPVCVGLYARWGSGKTFMISLLKKEFDPDVRVDPRTLRLLQFFEKGYDKQESSAEETASAEETVPVSSFICGLLLTIMMAFVPSFPYGVSTFFSIIRDAFDPREAPKAKTRDSGEGSEGHKGGSIRASLAGVYKRLPLTEEAKEKNVDKKNIEKEFVFVDFNAWECAACNHHSRGVCSVHA